MPWSRAYPEMPSVYFPAGFLCMLLAKKDAKKIMKPGLDGPVGSE